MKQSEKTMLEFAGFCFIKKPELANELNTLIADFINKPKEQLFIPRVSDTLIAWEQFKKANWYESEAIDV